MRRPGARCKEEHAHFNRNHVDGPDMNFFKVMIGHFRERMTIPDEFQQYFRGKIPRTIKLRSRSGCTFDAEVTKNLSKLSLQSGWKAFATAHDLQMGDFLVFTYEEGISELKFLIFGPSGCEKVPSCSLHDHSPSNSQTQWGSSKQENNIANIEDAALQGDDFQVHPLPGCIIPKRTRLTDAQKQQLENKVQAIHSEIPIYGCILRKTSIQGKPQTVDICPEYADVYLPSNKRLNIRLQRHGKNWDVQCRTNKIGSKRLSKGWICFARDNNLHVGDICLFELLNNKECTTMNVHVIPEK
ncbi:putative B3 domain-containing protein Os03g0621600 [Oryza brachyantha]|uniref:TF-B3 domain-containing protein n=1 Tax=Oryza brachyantha TaxID=4533 RepID=J3LQW2_ORYBR|nr:putative B3 domain-containing protein Os03g0621600 [Oryza brachyantha]